MRTLLPHAISTQVRSVRSYTRLAYFRRLLGDSWGLNQKILWLGGTKFEISTSNRIEAAQITKINGTSADTRDALRRLHTAWLNILMKRLLGDERGREHPCWVVVDEVHVLKHLPALSTALIEGRKYGVKMVLGTQNKAQFEEHYGRGAATMLSAPHEKILFRHKKNGRQCWRP